MRRHCYILLSIILNWLLSVFTCNANTNAHFKNLSIADGLSQNYISSIIQDDQNFMWFGTRNGLNKYDGFQIKEYVLSEEKNQSADNHIKSLFKDSTGKIWSITDNRLFYYQPNEDKFLEFKRPELVNKNNSLLSVSSISEDNNKILWIGTRTGILLGYDLKNPSNPLIKSASVNAPIHAITSIKNSLIIGCEGENGIWHLDKKKLSFFQTSTDSLYNNMHVSCFQQNASQELLFISKECGIMKYGEREAVIKHKNKNDFIKAFIPWNESKILYTTENNGTFSYDKKNKNEPLKRIDIEETHLDIIPCICFYKDTSGGLWIGTTNAGLFYSNPSHNDFHFESLTNQINNTTSYNSVLSLCPMEDNKILVGLDHKGIQIYDKELRSLSQHPITKKYPQLSAASINGVFYDSRGFTWIATYMQSIKVYGPEPEQSLINKQLEEILSNDFSVKSVYEDSKHRIWIATTNGPILCYHPDKRKFTKHIYKNVKAFTLLEDKIGRIWLGSCVGLYQFNEQNSNFEFVLRVDNENEYGYANNIFSICEVDSALWLCTHEGLIEYFPKNKKYNVYTTQDGLSSNQTKSALYDKEGKRLWVSTDKGLSALNLKTRKFYNYGIEDNIRYKEFNHASSMKDKEGNFYFGCVNGFYRFNPKQIKENINVPQVVITNLRIPNNRLQGKETNNNINSELIPIGDKKELEIPFRNSIFTLQFVAPSYVNSQKIEYACRLVNFSDKWTYMGKEHSVTFTSLRPGTYHFQVKASSGNGVWNDDYTSLKLVILPPWYLTIGAFIGYFFIAICITILLMKMYANRIKIRSQLANEQFERQHLEKLNEMKMSFFSNVTHELRTPLTLILSPINNLLNKTVPMKDKHNYMLVIQRNAILLLELVNELLDFSKSEAGNMEFNPNETELVEVINKQIEIFRPLANDKHINLEFNHTLNLLWCMADKSIIKKIVSNLLSNALKYTPDEGSVCIDLQIVNDGNNSKIRICVKDTGRGIAEQDQSFIFNRFYQIKDNDSNGTGIGLALVKNLASIHHGTISLKSKLGEGSSFTLDVPFVKVERTDETIAQSETLSDTAYINASESKTFMHPKTYKILIAEDNKDLLFYLSQLLSSQYNVITAVNGKIGLEKAQSEMPDVILSDVLMPEMDGKEFCKQVKQNVNTCHIPFLLLTALISKESEKECLAIGADDYITKPFDSDILLTKIANLIKSRILITRREQTLTALKPNESPNVDKDSQFLLELIELIKNNLSKSDLKIDDLSREMGISHTPFYKKIKELTNQTPNEFLKQIRLEQAKKMLSEKNLTISEIAYQTGFNSPKYFRNCFKDQYGMTPSEYQESLS